MKTRIEKIFELYCPHIEKLILLAFYHFEGQAKQQSDWIKIVGCSKTSFARTSADLIQRGLVRRDRVDGLSRYQLCF